jgi:DNA invertase Pin-like site-specific DNA recombinase
MAPLSSEPKSLIGVIRVSTDKQDLARQRTDLERIQLSYPVKFLRIEEISDVSGRHVMSDPQIQGILRDMEQSRADGIGISALDRLFRPDRYESFAILDIFRDHNKLIYSAKEGLLDPSSDAGFIMSLMSGAQAGMEWRELRRRTMQGKEEARKGGRDAAGSQTLPRGVIYQRTRNASGTTISGTWKHDGIDSERMRQAYYLLLRNLSCASIAEKVGGGWTGKGIRGSLKNPIWIGYREYKWVCSGPEYLPKKTKDTIKPAKPRRKLALREDSYLKKVDIPNLVDEDVWKRAQQILAQRADHWRKSKLKNEDRQRFLANGILRCACGRSIYVRYGVPGHGRDSYYCASRYRGGKGCGLANLYRTELDEAVQRMFTSRTFRLQFIAAIHGRQDAMRQRAADPGRPQREAALAKLATRRENLLDMREAGEVTREEYKARMAKIEQEKRELEAMVPPPPVAYDAHRLVKAIAGAFRGFAKLPFAAQRELLRRAVGEITIQNRSIITITFRGGFLGEITSTANLEPQSIPRCSRRFQAQV